MSRSNGHRPKLIRRPTKPALVEIGYCHNGQVAAEFMASILRTYIWDAGHAGRFQRVWDQRGPYIAASRNSVVRSFLEAGESDWLLFVDNDMIFDGNVMERLYAAADPKQRPVVAGLYVTYLSDDGEVRPLPTWMHEDEDGRPLRIVMEVPEGDELVPLDGCGMGLTLIHRSVLEAVGAAHADDEWPWFAHDLRIFDEEIGAVRCGEDITFCLRARDLGFPIFGAPSIRAAHVKTQVLTEMDVLPGLRIVAA